jgi:nitrogen fixation-related uncharacterized protein
MAIFSVIVIYIIGVIFLWFIKSLYYQDKIYGYEERMHEK